MTRAVNDDDVTLSAIAEELRTAIYDQVDKLFERHKTADVPAVLAAEGCAGGLIALACAVVADAPAAEGEMRSYLHACVDVMLNAAEAARDGRVNADGETMQWRRCESSESD